MAYINDQVVSKANSVPVLKDKPRERRKEARPGEILAAALDLFVEKGFAATRADEVAALAGVSKGTVFLYFGSKEELFKAVVREAIVGNLKEFAERISGYEGGSGTLLREAMHQWWTKVGGNKAAGIQKLIIGEIRNFPELGEFYRREVMDPSHQLLHAILQRGVSSGEFREVNRFATIESLIAPMIHIMLWQHSLAPCMRSPDHDALIANPHQFIDHHLDVMLTWLTQPGPLPSYSRPRTP